MRMRSPRIVTIARRLSACSCNRTTSAVNAIRCSTGTSGSLIQACVCLVAQIDEFTEIAVDGDQHSVVGFRLFQQRPISRVGTQFPSLDDIVPVPAEPLCQVADRAPVYAAV